MNEKSILTRKPVIALLACVCCALWGSAIPMIKTGYGITGITASDAASQIVFAGIRFWLAGLLVLLFECIRQKRVIIPDRAVMKYAPILCLAQTVGQYIFFYIGVANSTGVTGGIITGMGNFFAIIVSCLILRSEKMSLRKAIGCLFGLAGIIIINLIGSSESGPFKLVGEGFILIAGISYALSSSMIREFSKYASAVLLSGCQFFIGGIIMVIIGLAMGGSIQVWTLGTFAVLVYLAMVSAVAYTLWSILLSHNSVSQVAIFGFATPICSVMMSAVILGEYSQAFRPSNLIALFLICVGIYVVNAGKA